MTSLHKSARAAGLRSCLPAVLLLGVLTAAQADPAHPPKYFITFAPQNDIQTLAVTEHDCDFTDVNFAVGTGVRNSYHCHVVSGLDVLLGRGAGVGNGSAANTVSTQAPHPTEYQYQAGTTINPDFKRPAANPGNPAIRSSMYGMIVISFDTPSGTEIHQFVLNNNNLRALEPPAGGRLTFASQWRVLNSEIPAIQQLSPGPYAVSMDAPNAPARPVPGTPSNLRLDVQGTDCTAQFEELPKTACAVVLWNPMWISVVVSGAYLKQPDQFVRIDLHPVTNDPGHWAYTPAQFTPYSPLMAAVQKNDIAAVQAALAQGANPSEHPAGLEAPLATALQRRDLDIAEVLVDRGADVNVTTKDGASMLAIAIGDGAAPQDHARWFEFVKKLIAHHADVNRVAPGNLTPLMAALALSVQRDVVDLLLASGADVNATTTPSQGVFGLGGRPITAYDFAQAELDAFNEMKATEGMNKGETDPVPPLQAVMALLARRGAKFLPDGGALATDHIRAQAGAGTLALVGAPGAAAEGETVTLTDVTTGKAASGPVAKGGAFRVQVAGAPADLYGAKLSRGTLAGRPVYLHGDDPVLALHVDSPAPGATVEGTDITVSGTFAGPQNMGITVSYGRVQRFGNRFVADVQLKPGQNALTLAASTLGGMKLTQELDVTSRGAPALRFQVFSKPGPKSDPLHRSLQVLGADPGSVRTLKVSYEGGKDDVVTSDPAQIRAAMSGFADQSPLSHRFPAPGIYGPRVTLVGTDGAVSTFTQPAVIEDPDQADKAIQSAWRDYVIALGAGDADAALAMLSDEGRDKMRSVLPVILPKGREIVASFSPLMGNKPGASETTAEYAIHRSGTPPNSGNIFFIEFIRYPDGVWHVDSM